MSDEEIKNTTKSKLKSILRQKIHDRSLEYLLNMRGSKGKEMIYTKLQMSIYLSPSEYKVNISEKIEIFKIRNRMINIFDNFPSRDLPKYCQAGCQNIVEDMKHIYMCQKLNSAKKNVEYENIYTNNMTNILIIQKILNENLNTRQQIIEQKNIQIPSDPDRDPLSVV